MDRDCRFQLERDNTGYKEPQQRFANYTEWENWRFANPEKAQVVLSGNLNPLRVSVSEEIQDEPQVEDCEIVSPF